MTSAKAQAAKDKGNTSFKNGDYPSAIGYYTQAILEDSSDWTFPLNRAAAYLKLGKNEDAERDCTSVLNLNKSNVKALFRRAQARRALGKLSDAQKDLELAASLDSSNESVKNELSSIKDQIWKFSSSDVVHPLRRRVPIKIIEPPTKTNPAPSPSPTRSSTSTREATLKEKPPLTSQAVSKTNLAAISTSPPTASTAVTPYPPSTTPPPSSSSPASLSSSSPPVPESPPVASAAASKPTAEAPKAAVEPEPSSSSTSPTTSFQQAKRARDENVSKVSRVGGGIFRASGKNTIFNTRTSGVEEVVEDGNEGESSSLAARDDNADHRWGSSVSLGTKTSTLFEFTRGWDRLAQQGEEGLAEERFRYIMAIDPSSYPNMFQNSLEPPVLMRIFKTFRGALDENGPNSSPNSSAAGPTSVSPPANQKSAHANVASLISTVLHALLQVRRIRTVAMFLRSGEREMMRDVVVEVFRASERGLDGDGEKDRDTWLSMLK
ncbi:hypothetical protein GYMLUDRAFT_38190 [Collybiopsis luxurians FD-317 M1]|nr:hypothetical protein GYMLUDRAFT_38190 [Collybiopsis luxurians FD-317 M1]